MKETIASTGDILSIPSAFGYSVLGFSIVFFVLIVLMFVIKAIRGVVEQMAANQAAPAAATAAAVPAAAAAPKPAASASGMVPAKGSLGEIKLHSVDDKTAAMLMAIVADKIGAPLNELRFLSIREKK